MIHDSLVSLIMSRLGSNAPDDCHHLSFSENSFIERCCNLHCPLDDPADDDYSSPFAHYPAVCHGSCRRLDDNTETAYSIVDAADSIIDDVMKNGRQVLPLDAINPPTLEDRPFTDIGWEEYFNSDKGLCAGCQLLHSTQCPEDTLAGDCPRHLNAWAVELITDAANELIFQELR